MKRIAVLILLSAYSSMIPVAASAQKKSDEGFTKEVYTGTLVNMNGRSLSTGFNLTITARTTETLSTAPVVVVYEPGLVARKVTMTKTASTTWTAKITPKTTAAAGTLTLKVSAKDTLGGVNASTVKLPLE